MDKEDIKDVNIFEDYAYELTEVDAIRLFVAKFSSSYTLQMVLEMPYNELVGVMWQTAEEIRR